MLLCHFGVFIVICYAQLSQAIKQCRPSTYSEYGHHLSGHVVSTRKNSSISKCVMVCANDSRCKSLNFRLKDKSCDLNDADKHTHPKDYGPKEGSVYMSKDETFKSYSEILNEMPHAESGYYWIKTENRDVRVYCDMRKHERQPAYESCQMSLGMEDGRIKDSALSASSIFDATHAAKQGRLNLVLPSGYVGAWCPKIGDAHPWIQIDLGRPTNVTKVATQGRQDGLDQWVTSYDVSYSLVSPNWVYHMSHGKKKVFPGNYDRDSIVTHEFVPAFHARRVKIHPLSYHKWLCMRVELYGCLT